MRERAHVGRRPCAHRSSGDQCRANSALTAIDRQLWRGGAASATTRMPANGPIGCGCFEARVFHGQLRPSWRNHSPTMFARGACTLRPKPSFLGRRRNPGDSRPPSGRTGGRMAGVMPRPAWFIVLGARRPDDAERSGSRYDTTKRLSVGDGGYVCGSRLRGLESHRADENRQRCSGGDRPDQERQRPRRCGVIRQRAVRRQRQGSHIRDQHDGLSTRNVLSLCRSGSPSIQGFRTRGTTGCQRAAYDARRQEATR